MRTIFNLLIQTMLLILEYLEQSYIELLKAQSVELSQTLNFQFVISKVTLCNELQTLFSAVVLVQQFSLLRVKILSS